MRIFNNIGYFLVGVIGGILVALSINVAMAEPSEKVPEKRMLQKSDEVVNLLCRTLHKEHQLEGDAVESCWRDILIGKRKYYNACMKDIDSAITCEQYLKNTMVTAAQKACRWLEMYHNGKGTILDPVPEFCTYVFKKEKK